MLEVKKGKCIYKEDKISITYNKSISEVNMLIVEVSCNYASKFFLVLICDSFIWWCLMSRTDGNAVHYMVQSFSITIISMLKFKSNIWKNLVDWRSLCFILIVATWVRISWSVFSDNWILCILMKVKNFVWCAALAITLVNLVSF